MGEDMMVGHWWRTLPSLTMARAMVLWRPLIYLRSPDVALACIQARRRSPFPFPSSSSPRSFFISGNKIEGRG